MKTLQKNTVSTLLSFLAIYLVIVIISGVVKTNIITGVIENEEMLKIARLSAYVSLFIGGVFSVFFIYLLSGVSYFINSLLKSQIKNTTIIAAIKSVVLVFIGFEIVKILMSFFMLTNSIDNISFQDDLLPQLEETDWYVYNNYFKYAIIVFASYVFGIELYSKTKHVKYKNVLILSFVLFGFLFLTTTDFL